MRSDRLFQKVYGALLGGALGDAFAIRTEMMHYRDIEAQYGRVQDFEPLPPRRPSEQPPVERWYPFAPGWSRPDQGFHPLGRWSDESGVYTDDTRYRLMTCQAIIRKRGPITGRDLAAEWINYRLMAEGAEDHLPTLSWPGPERAYARGLASVERLALMVTQQRPCISGWDGPLGLMHAGDPRAAAEVGYVMAVAIATALLPHATLDQVIANVVRYAGCLGSLAAEFTGRLSRVLEIAARCQDVFALREPFYREFLVTFPPWEAVFSLEMVPCAFALAVAARGDVEQALIGAANLGRDSDTIASIVGELLGALHGAAALPAVWVERVVQLNPEPPLAAMAADLAAIIEDQARDDSRRAAELLSLSERTV